MSKKKKLTPREKLFQQRMIGGDIITVELTKEDKIWINKRLLLDGLPPRYIIKD